MKRIFKDLSAYIKLHDGANKPRINFQDMYRFFPEFTFTALPGFGSYTHFGEAYEAKNFPMLVSTADGKAECVITYREYGDANENLAYVTAA